MKIKQIVLIASFLFTVFGCQKDQIEVQYETPPPPPIHTDTSQISASQVVVSWENGQTREFPFANAALPHGNSRPIELGPELPNEIILLVTSKESSSGNITLSAKSSKTGFWIQLIREQMQSNTISLSLKDYHKLLAREDQEDFLINISLSSADHSYEVQIPFHVVHPVKEIFLSWSEMINDYGKEQLLLTPVGNKATGSLQTGQIITLPARSLDTIQLDFKESVWPFLNEESVISCTLQNVSTKDVIPLSGVWEASDMGVRLKVQGLKGALNGDNHNNFVLSLAITDSSGFQYSYTIDLYSIPQLALARFENLIHGNVAREFFRIESMGLSLLGYLYVHNNSSHELNLRLPRSAKAIFREKTIEHAAIPVPDTYIYKEASLPKESVSPETNLVFALTLNGHILEQDLLKSEISLRLVGGGVQQIAVYAEGIVSSQLMDVFYKTGQFNSITIKPYCVRFNFKCSQTRNMAEGKEMQELSVIVTASRPAQVSFSPNEPVRATSMIPPILRLF